MAFYKTLFTITLNNTYFSGLLSKDFTLQPDAATAAMLRNYRVLLKPTEHGLIALYEAQDAAGNAVIGFDQETRFRFYLRSTNPHLSSYTDLPGLESGKVYYFKQPVDYTPINIAALEYKGPVFKHTIPGTTLTVRGPVSQFTVTPPALSLTGLTPGEVEVNLTDFPAGTYLVVETGHTFVVDSSVNASTLGVVEIFLESHPAAGAAIDHSIDFQARSEVWRYYVVFPSVPANSYAIQNLPGYTFANIGDPIANGTAEEKLKAEGLLTGKYASGGVRLFRSQVASVDTAVPYSDTIVSGITLENTTLTTTLIENLPNPSVRNVQADMVVYVNE